MAEPIPLRERSAEALIRGLKDGEFDIKQAMLAQRLLQDRQRRRRTRWSLPVAIVGAALAATLVTAAVLGLLR